MREERQSGLRNTEYIIIEILKCEGRLESLGDTPLHGAISKAMETGRLAVRLWLLKSIPKFDIWSFVPEQNC